MRKLIALAMAVLALGAFSAVAMASGGNPSNGNLVERLQANPDKYSTLVSLVVKADLAGALAGIDEATVFAPTNQAFERLAASNPDLFAAVLADKALLTKVLLYHVSPGETTASEIVGLTRVPTLLTPQKIKVSVKNGSVFLNRSSKVVTTDIQASNGVIHAITEVLIPRV